MKLIPRLLTPHLKAALKDFPAVVLTGPRQSGKTTLLRSLFPKADYVLLEDPDVIARVEADPRAFLDGLRLPVILDEIQSIPELFRYVRSRIDASPKQRGRWILTGSQEAPLMQGVSESMAGRAAILQLLPLSYREDRRVSILRGGFPACVKIRKLPKLWFSSYLQTYLERDLRQILSVQNLGTFRRFLSLLASRHGQILNRSDIAAPLGVSVPTVQQWISVLEITQQIVLVPPFFENFGKRLIKSPRVYFLDSGLLCHLLGIETANELEKSPFYGAIFEGFIASEIIKFQANSGGRKELYFFRDEQGLEVDFVVPAGSGSLKLIEAKASRTPIPSMATSLIKLAAAVPKRFKTKCLVVHQAAGMADFRALLPGVEAISWKRFLDGLQ